MSNAVAAGSLVFAHMTLLLPDGSVADSTRSTGKPSVIRLGDGSVSEALEASLIGKLVGDRVKVTLQAEDAFGEPQPNLIQFMEIHQFPADIKLEEGVVIAFEQPDGSQLPGIIREVQGHSVKVDFNHPLAGQEITFDIEILSIDQPPAS
jgi:FKBP-type peptidyl-prolyl cis-trans isomerase SlpA